VKDHKYVYNGTNRLTSVTTSVDVPLFSLGYDVQGNLTSKGTQSFIFDYGNRLRIAAQSGNLVENYRYDANGRRVSSWNPPTGSILSFYGKDGVLRYQRDERVAKATDYISLGSTLVARVSNAIAPGAPYVTAPATNSSGSYTVQWTARAGATSYELQETANNGTTWQSIFVGAGTSKAITGKANGIFGYRANACSNTLGCSAWSQTAIVSVSSPPTSAPALAAPATAANGSYTVSWTSVTSAIFYLLEEKVNAGTFVEAYNGGLQSKDYTGKPAGTYKYRVKACNESGCGGYSEEVPVQSVYPVTGTSTVTAPSLNTTGSFTVSWTTVDGATSYRLEERFNNGPFNQIQDAASTSAPMSGKVAGSYGYRVKACNIAGCGDYSATAPTQVTLAPTSAPTVSVPSTSSTGSYTVSWTSVATATSYQLEEQVNNGSFTLIQDAASTSRAISGKGNGTYGYRARACNAGGCGGYSSPTPSISVSIPPPPPPVPANLSVRWVPFGENYRYTATWSASSGAKTYDFALFIVANGTFVTRNSGTSTQYVYTLPEVETENKWSVRACSASGCSNWATPVFGLAQ
jgi:hypothetical protein